MKEIERIKAIKKLTDIGFSANAITTDNDVRVVLNLPESFPRLDLAQVWQRRIVSENLFKWQIANKDCMNRSFSGVPATVNVKKYNVTERPLSPQQSWGE